MSSNNTRFVGVVLGVSAIMSFACTGNTVLGSAPPPSRGQDASGVEAAAELGLTPPPPADDGGVTADVTADTVTEVPPSTDVVVPAEPKVWILFDSLRALNRDVYAVRPDGSDLRRLTEDPASDQEPAVSPDGESLLFSSNRAGVFQIYKAALGRVMSTGAPVTQLTQGPGPAMHPAWSSDGKQIAYSGPDGIVLMNADGTDANVVMPRQSAPPLANPSFSRDNRLFADGYNSIHERSADGSHIVAIIPGFTGPTQHPSITQDGHQMVFSVMCETQHNSIWLVALGGTIDVCGTGVRLTPAGTASSRFPSVNSAGEIAFEMGDGPSKIALLFAAPNLRTITDGPSDDRNPTWATVP